jgi:hypothetical protein
MLIDSPKKDLLAKREIKVKLPAHTHIKLHSLKILEGQGISETVEAALEMYFGAQRPEEP